MLKEWLMDLKKLSSPYHNRKWKDPSSNLQKHNLMNNLDYFPMSLNT